jgi:hypothetical protein
MAWLAARASAANRGTLLRKSPASNVVVVSIVPVRKPLPRGLNGTNPMPSSDENTSNLVELRTRSHRSRSL